MYSKLDKEQKLSILESISSEFVDIYNNNIKLDSKTHC